MRDLAPDEESALRLFREHKALPSTMACPGKGSIRCLVSMKERRRNVRGQTKRSRRCPKNTCRKEISIRGGNPLFSYISFTGKRNSNISLRDILELMWLFFLKMYSSCSCTSFVSRHFHCSRMVKHMPKCLFRISRYGAQVLWYKKKPSSNR